MPLVSIAVTMQIVSSFNNHKLNYVACFLEFIKETTNIQNLYNLRKETASIYTIMYTYVTGIGNMPWGRAMINTVVDLECLGNPYLYQKCFNW